MGRPRCSRLVAARHRARLVAGVVVGLLAEAVVATESCAGWYPRQERSGGALGCRRPEARPGGLKRQESLNGTHTRRHLAHVSTGSVVMPEGGGDPGHRPERPLCEVTHPHFVMGWVTQRTQDHASEMIPRLVAARHRGGLLAGVVVGLLAGVLAACSPGSGGLLAGVGSARSLRPSSRPHRYSHQYATGSTTCTSNQPPPLISKNDPAA